jgi:hypothetical protein
MTLSRWRDSGHLERAVETAGGQQAFDAATGAMLDDARGWRLAEMRKRCGAHRRLRRRATQNRIASPGDADPPGNRVPTSKRPSAGGNI